MELIMRQPFCIWQDIYIIGDAEISHPHDCCVYLIDAGELVLIDTGAGESFSYLVDNIYTLGFNPEQLTAIIATHAHIDHIGALARFKQKYDVKVIAHELEAQAIESGKGIGAEFYGVVYQPYTVDIRLKETEQDICFDRYTLKTLHIHGHTKGSIAVYMDIAGRRVLFGQDIHGPYDIRWGGDPVQAVISLQKLKDLNADILCEGHFGIYQPANEVNQYIEDYRYQLQQMLNGTY